MGINDLKRGVAKIDRPEVSRGHSDAHRVRQLVPPGNWAATDPFLLLMEDWFPVGVFDRHPHRGIETVTYVLDTSMLLWSSSKVAGRSGHRRHRSALETSRG